MKMKKFLALMLAVVMIAAMCTACGSKGYTSENTEYVIVLLFRTPLSWLLTRSTLLVA